MKEGIIRTKMAPNICNCKFVTLFYVINFRFLHIKWTGFDTLLQVEQEVKPKGDEMTTHNILMDIVIG
jgi:hypothetical protein